MEIDHTPPFNDARRSLSGSSWRCLSPVFCLDNNYCRVWKCVGTFEICRDGAQTPILLLYLFIVLWFVAIFYTLFEHASLFSPYMYMYFKLRQIRLVVLCNFLWCYKKNTCTVFILGTARQCTPLCIVHLCNTMPRYISTFGNQFSAQISDS